MGEAWQSLYKNKWLVLAFSIWIQSCSGVGYAFGSYSPVIKRVLGFDQKGISRLGVAKDIGDSVGLLAGTLCDLLPIWGLFICGALINLIGYGSMWMIVTKQLPPVPLWAMCIIMMLATNGETFFNTGALVACVRNFPQNRGGIVGILKGFTGLSGAIFTQLYTSFYAPDQAKFIFLVATGPSMVALFTLFIVRPIPQVTSIIKEDDKNFNVIYSVCLVIAAYLMGAMIVHDFFSFSHTVQVGFAFGLLLLLFIPLIVPFYQVFVVDPNKPQPDIEADNNIKAPLLAPPPPERTPSGREIKNEYPKAIKPTTTYFAPPSGDLIEFSEMEDEKMRPELSERSRHEQLMRMSSRLYKAVAEGAVKVKRKRGPRRGQDFTLAQALIKADFWLMFIALVCGAGTGITAIDNLGQMGEAQGFSNAHIFVSLISIWSFLGRLGAGYASEIVARDYAAPRPILMACAQGMMAVGHIMFAMAWPGSMYIASLLVGFGYGCHWAIVPATASELFGLKNFGALYNVLTIAVPVGSLIFSGLIAGPVYDAEAEKQRSGALGAYARGMVKDLVCEGAICFQLTFFIMTAVCLFGVLLNLVLIKRTYRVYQSLYARRGDSLLHNKVPQGVLEQDASSSNSYQ